MAMSRSAGSPVYILGEDTRRTSGRDAQGSNVAAGKAIAESVRTTLGPRGMDKMLVDTEGNVVITNDGVTILEEMDVEHPAAGMLVEVARAQEDEVGDGTTTAAVLAGQLLAEAQSLLDDDVHPTTVVEGYAEARRIARDVIDDIADDDVDDELLHRVAVSSMTGKGTGDVSADHLAALVVDAVRRVEGDDGVRRDDVHVFSKTGGSAGATGLVAGVVVDEEPMRDDTPREVANATVAVLDAALGPRETEIDAEYAISSVEQLDAAVDAEKREIRGYADALADAGVDVVFATGSVDDRAAAALAREGVLAFENLSSSDAAAVAAATGASRVGTVLDVDAADLGSAERVRVESYDGDDVTFVEGGADAGSVTVFVRGGTEHVLDELERALADALDVATAALDRGGVVPGAGATDIRVAGALRDAAAGIRGRRQLAVEAFADALDALPRTLAANAGLDPIDALVDLRAANESGVAGVVVDAETGRVADPVAAGVLDPAAVKREAVDAATEAATMLVRIDDIIAAK